MRAEIRQTHMLFGVATIFIIGHSLRIAMNIQELVWLINGRYSSTSDQKTAAACEGEVIDE